MNVGKTLPVFNGYPAGNTARTLWLLTVLILVQLALSPWAQAQDISARVDRAQLSLDETLALQVRVSPQSNTAPDFSQLEKQFDILGQTQSSQYRNINGQIEAFTEWQLTLAPKAQGQLVIPSFEYMGNYSNAILIDVSAAPAAGDTRADVYLDLSVDNATPYVQEQVIVSLKLATAIPLRIQDASNLSLPDALLVNLDDTQYQKRVGEKLYTIKEWRYALFPQKSGRLEIPQQVFTVATGSDRSWNNPFQYSTGATKRLRSKALTLEVQPQPANYQGEHWLPAQQLSLSESWSEGNTQWTVGEPINRHIIISAQGLTENQIPSLALKAPRGLKYYQEPTERNDQTSSDGLTATVAESLAIVPTQAGRFTLPEVTLSWWNLNTQQMETARLPARTVEVANNPALANSAPHDGQAQPHREPQAASDSPTEADDETQPNPPLAAPNAATQQPPNPWFWLTLALAATNIATLCGLIWLWARAPKEGLAAPDDTTSAPAPGAPVTELERLCSQPMTPANATAILRWLNRWSEPLGKAPLAKRLGHYPALVAQINALEAMAYGAHSHFAGEISSLLAEVRAANPVSAATDKQKENQPLKPLYPEQV
ncbi:BatD family protein [Simiduia sp. 21SJ11W-1]|uniref:BatD family protein n=1 Tax=Simiduia sp. 21SJ11W-1 TaxID=2909669 RepID=UPI00209F6471|nr:BatD family protein [Simiduia sp. 21SJ11W-1]UTA49357.1 BatD family protein [Simiduia sp. 21SJ11W-1]